MKVIDIESTEQNSALINIINQSLESGYYNEYLYRRTFIQVKFVMETTDDYVGMLRAKRANYLIGDTHKEHVFIKTFPLEFSDKIFVTDVPLLTFINFIYEATPPILRNKIPESITSIDNIVNVLKTFLIEELAGDGTPGGSDIYNIDLLKKYLNMLEDIHDVNKLDDRSEKLYKLMTSKSYNKAFGYEMISYSNEDNSCMYKQYAIILPKSDIVSLYANLSRVGIVQLFEIKPTGIMDAPMVYMRIFLSTFISGQYSLLKDGGNVFDDIVKDTMDYLSNN